MPLNNDMRKKVYGAQRANKTSQRTTRKQITALVNRVSALPSRPMGIARAPAALRGFKQEVKSCDFSLTGGSGASTSTTAVVRLSTHSMTV